MEQTDVPTSPISTEEIPLFAEETPGSSAYDYYRNRITPTPSELCVQELLEFERDMGSDMVIRACQIALDNRISGNIWNYSKRPYILPETVRYATHPVTCRMKWSKNL